MKRKLTEVGAQNKKRPGKDLKIKGIQQNQKDNKVIKTQIGGIMPLLYLLPLYQQFRHSDSKESKNGTATLGLILTNKE